MSTRVVDTNVAVVANGRDTHASPKCRLKCVELLSSLREHGRAVIDSDGSIIAEYAKRLHPEGQPGVGDMFFRHVLGNQANAAAVLSVDVKGDRATALIQAFVKGTLRKFDADDRVFALASAVSRAPVATATDTDWPMHHAGLHACGASIVYVCGRGVAEAGGVEE